MREFDPVDPSVPHKPPSMEGMDETITVEAEAGAPEGRVVRRGGTFASMRYRDYRYFWVGALISNTGSWMQMVAIGWLVYDIARTSTALGVVNFLNGLPTLVFAIFAGDVADRVDRRRLLIAVQALLTVQALALGVFARYRGDSLGVIYGLVLFGGVVSAFNFPAWMAMVPDLVPRRSLLNAIALNAAQFNSARMLGPMLGAFIFARFGVADVFFVNAVSFLFVIWALAVIRPEQVVAARPDGEGVLRRVTAGLSYARSHIQILMLLLSTAMLTVFGMPYMTLMPVIARKVLGLGGVGYSLLMAASGLGSLVGALAVAGLPPALKRSDLIRYGVVSMALLLLVFSAVPSVYVAVPVVALAGAAFLTCTSAINTSLQTSVPPGIRARVMSLFVISFIGMMPVGSIAFGALGDVVTARGSVAIGAGVLLAYSLILLARPKLVMVGGSVMGEVARDGM